MVLNSSKGVNKWITTFTSTVSNAIKEYKNYRCQIVKISVDKDTKQVSFLVMINGLRKQFLTYAPKDLVSDESMLCAFPWYDVRAITFYSLQQYYSQSAETLYSVVSQSISNNKTIFTIKNDKSHVERKSAFDLYRDADLLKKFGHEDLKNIISTAVQEQSLEELKILEVL